jgi:serine phosphatase RsbU (regulator of sigma subunit)/predicted ester cyclase
MSAEENMALARRFLEARGRADLDAMEEMMAPDFVDHTLAPGQRPDREGYKRQVAEYVTAFSDVRFVIEDQVAAGDKVVSRISGWGIHDRRELMGTAPTGREMAYMAIVIHRISEGKIAEEWGAGTGLSELRGRRLEQEVRERERIEQELRVARRIQHALLPEAAPALDGWEITYHYQPAREVGGDFYDFLELADGCLGIIVGDVSGKGIPAAVLMASTRSILRTVAQRGGTEPGQVLEQANDVLCSDVPPNMFVTCFYGVLDPESGGFRYANAGHNLPCRRHDSQADELRARGMPLGIMLGMSYEEKEAMLAAGDDVLFYSDGLVEAHSPQGEMFGSPRLRSLLTEPLSSGTSLTALVVEELGRFTGEGWEQEDDLTLVTLRHSAT